MLLSDDGDEIARISSPKFKVWKTYWAQVEGIVSDEQLARLQNGVQLNDGPTRPAKARRIPEPANLWPRNPPIRERKNVPDSWLELSIAQGKNRQVRRMTAAVGLPTLRLIRAAIGDHRLEQLQPGQWRQLDGFEAGTPARASVPRPAPGNDLMDPHKPMLIRPWKRDGR